jgi:hypothetical protein
MNEVVVCGAGGFIGGHLVADLLREGGTRVRAVDVKPIDEWFQVFGEADNRVADLSDREACREALEGARYVFNLADDMGGMGFIEPTRPVACCPSSSTHSFFSQLANTRLSDSSSARPHVAIGISSGSSLRRVGEDGHVPRARPGTRHLASRGGGVGCQGHCMLPGTTGPSGRSARGDAGGPVAAEPTNLRRVSARPRASRDRSPEDRSDDRRPYRGRRRGSRCRA